MWNIKKPGNFLDPIQAVDDMASSMRDLLQCAGHMIDGLVILIDEADKPDAMQAKLGEIVKLLTERLTRLNCDQVCIGLAGLPTLVPKLRESHESAPRIFETLTLDVLSMDDRKMVISQGLNEANRKNKRETTIKPEALQLLAERSEGYPHFLQEFSYWSFQEDTDYAIDEEDINIGIFKKGGAIYQLGKRYFEALYYEKISSADYRKVLQAMALRGDTWVSRQDIIQLSGIKPTQVNNALNALKTRNIILTNDKKPGQYRLPTKSFAVWLTILGEKADEVLNEELPGQ
ncbi:aspartate/glutamate racemase family protein [Rhodopila globiformis]|nr:hypothetical protein [Rhodopila globiformis]